MTFQRGDLPRSGRALRFTAGLVLVAPLIWVCVLCALYLWQIAPRFRQQAVDAAIGWAQSEWRTPVRLGEVLLDLRRGQFLARNVFLGDPLAPGRPLVAAREVTVSNLYSQQINIQVDQAVAHVVRLPDGRWNFSPLLPKRRRPPPETFWSVRITDGTLHFMDHRAQPALSTTLQQVRGEISSSAGVSTFHFTHGHSDVGMHATVDGWLHDGKLRLRVDASEVPVAKLLAYTRTKGLEAADARTTGTVWVYTDEQRRIRYAGKAQLSASQIRWRSAQGTVVLNHIQGEGAFQTGVATWQGSASAGSGRISASGTVHWQPKNVLDVRVDGRSIPPAQLRPWVRRLAPQVTLSAPMDARLAVQGTVAQPVISGEVSTARAAIQKLDLQRIRAKVILNAQTVRVPESEIQIAGGVVRGQAAAWKGQKDWQFAARWSAKDVNLARLRPYVPADVRGIVRGDGLAYGSLAKPQVVANVHGRRLAGQLWRCEQAQARLQWTPGKLTIGGALLEDWAGSGYLSGEVDLQHQRMNLRVRVDEALLAPWMERLAPKLKFEGDPPWAWVYARGELQGTFSKPVFRGVVEAIDLQWQRWALDYLVARVEASPENLLVTGGIVRRPPMEVQWQAQLRHPLDAEKAELVLDGVASNVDAQEVLTALRSPDADSEPLPLEAIGRVFFHLSGNPRAPAADVTLSAPTAQIRDWSLTGITGALRYENGMLTVSDLSAKLGEGVLRAQGDRDREGRLAFRVEGQNLPLSQIQPLLPADAPREITGAVFLRADVKGTESEPEVQAEVVARDAAVDVLEVASGYAQVEWRNGQLAARDVHLASPELELVLHDFRLNTDSRTLTADGTLSVSSVQALTQRATESPWLTSKYPRIGEALREVGPLSGTATVPFQLSGDSQKPSVEASVYLQEMAVDGRALGTLRAQVQRDTEGTWHIVDSVIANGEHRLTASGSYSADGTVKLSAEAYNFDLSWFQRWLPQAKELRGRLEMATLEVLGASDAPDLTLTMALREPQYGAVRAERVMTGKIQVSGQRLDISEIVVAQSDGSVRIWGSLPFRWQPAGVPDDEPMDVYAEAPAQPLQSLLAYLPGAKVSEATGQWQMKAHLAGTRTAPQLSGEMSVRADSLRSETLRTGLRDLRASVLLENQTVRLAELSAVGDTPRGGRIVASGAVTFGGTEQEQLDATVRLERFWLDERNLSGQYGEQIRAFVDGELRITGSAESPQVTGMIIASGGALALPSSFPEQKAEVRPLAISPRFANVVLRVGEGMWLNSPRLSTQASGDIVLSGSLQEPIIHGQLGLERGYVYFPTARFRLEPGGTIALDYPVPGDNPFRVNVNVQANTSLSFASTTGATRRYSVSVLVNGAITSPEGLRTEFRSDPPDLSTQQIARALGVGTLEELLAGRNMEQVLQREVVNLFTSAYVPQLFSPLERGIEEALQLREFRIEYDRSEPLTVTLVKRLWDGFSLSYWRTVSTQQDRYTLKILYELPEWTRLSRRLLLSFSVDEKQQTRWGIEGSFRF